MFSTLPPSKRLTHRSPTGRRGPCWRAFMDDARRLAARWEGRMPSTPSDLVEANLLLVPFVIDRYVLPSRLQDEDVVSAALVGLMDAARLWDARGSQFATFATGKIRFAIAREIAGTPWGAFPTGRSGPRSAARALARGQVRFGPVNLHCPARAPEVAAALPTAEAVAGVRAAIAQLPDPRWRFVARCRLEGLTLREIADVLGVSGKRIGQLDRKIADKLRWRLLRHFGGDPFRCDPVA